MNITKAFFVMTLLAVCTACSKGGASNPTPDPPEPPAKDTPIIKGADVSWLSQMEAEGIKFHNSAGTETDCLQLLKAAGINTIRLRVWVNPADGYNGNKDVIAKALRAKNLGLRLMIDLHYSDTWADPGHQATPAAWTSYDLARLKDTVYAYTYHVLDTLRSAGIVPSWVQVGNETNDGMLWPLGRASTNMAGFAALVESGYKAVKAFNDTTKVIVHISNGYDNSLFRWIFDGLKNNGAHWDIIGMSLYPSVSDWQTNDQSCLANMKDMVSRYTKPVMIVEVGMPADQPAICQSFLADIIGKVKSVPNGQGLGVLYWEPECYNSWQGYGLGAFDIFGRPSAALNAFNN